MLSSAAFLQARNRSETTSILEVLETDGGKRKQRRTLDKMEAIVTPTQLRSESAFNGKKVECCP